MEWVETTAKTVEEAKDILLDRLGVDEQEAEFDVVEEPKPGLFARMRGQARVRARVAPKAPPSKDDSRKPRRKKPSKSKSEGGAPKSAAPAAEPSSKSDDSNNGRNGGRNDRRDRPKREDRPQLDIDLARSDVEGFAAGLIEAFGVPAEVSVVKNEDDILEVNITGENLGRLIGPRGGMVSAIEELCRTRLQHLANGDRTPRLRVDVGGYRALRSEHLAALVDETIAKVKETGQPHLLDVVLANERKQVHDQVGEHEGVATRSEGEDPNRKVAVIPA